MTDDILSYNLSIKILPDQGSAKEISITYELSFWSYSGHIFFKKTLKYPIIGLTCLFSFKIEEMRISQNFWLDQSSAILLSLNLCKNSWKMCHFWDKNVYRQAKNKWMDAQGRNHRTTVWQGLKTCHSFSVIEELKLSGSEYVSLSMNFFKKWSSWHSYSSPFPHSFMQKQS